MYFSARTEGIRTLRHALRAAYRTAILAVQILVLFVFYNYKLLWLPEVGHVLIYTLYKVSE